MVLPISNEYPEFTSLTWFAIAAPQGTPHSITRQISMDVAAAMKASTVVNRLKSLSITPMVNTPAEATVFVEEDAKRWQKVVNLIGLQQE